MDVGTSARFFSNASDIPPRTPATSDGRPLPQPSLMFIRDLKIKKGSD